MVVPFSFRYPEAGGPMRFATSCGESPGNNMHDSSLSENFAASPPVVVICIVEHDFTSPRGPSNLTERSASRYC